MSKDTIFRNTGILDCGNGRATREMAMMLWLVISVLIAGVMGTDLAYAKCEVNTTDRTYADGQYVPSEVCDETGALKTAKGIVSTQLLTNVTATGAGTKYSLRCVNRTFQAMGATSSGSGSATVVIEASNKETPVEGTNVDWTTLGTITLTLGTTQTNDAFVSAASYRWIRARVSAISGTGATVNAYTGCGS